LSEKTSWFSRLRFRIAGIPRTPSGGFFESILRGEPIPAFKRFQKLPGKLAEAVKEATSEKGLFVPAFKARLGEQPPVSLAALVEYYLKDPAVMASVDAHSEQIAATGFYTVCNAGFEGSKKIVDEFCATVNMDALLMQISKEVVFAGNSFLERIFDTNKKLVRLKILPLSSIKTIERDKFGRLQFIIQQIGTETVTFAPNEIIHFCHNPADGSAWGTGLLHSLASTKQIDERTVRPAFLDIKARLEDDIQKIVHRYAAPKRLWNFEGVGDQKLQEEYAPTIQDAPADADFVTNKPVTVNSLDINPAARFDGMIDQIYSQVVQGLQSFVTRLFTAPGYTEASATVADNVAQRKIMYLQRFIARTVEKEVFEILLQQNEMDPVEAGIRIRWGIPDRPEVKMEHIVQLAQISATSGIEYLTRDEVRNMLAKNAGFELQEEPKGTREAAPVHEKLVEALSEMVFFRDDEGNIRIIPEDPAEAGEYKQRSKLAGEITAKASIVSKHPLTDAEKHEAEQVKARMEEVLRRYPPEVLEGMKLELHTGPMSDPGGRYASVAGLYDPSQDKVSVAYHAESSAGHGFEGTLAHEVSHAEQFKRESAGQEESRQFNNLYNESMLIDKIRSLTTFFGQYATTNRLEAWATMGAWTKTQRGILSGRIMFDKMARMRDPGTKRVADMLRIVGQYKPRGTKK